ncbi:MAG TPA: hypothetical protein P5256_01495 [Beijerinckiaceae bacterium]|nr:hypothetical protein [Rhodoblastus sp.]MCC2106153.1 hypothetical protein [Hyphomicrobiales bacterium]MCO5089190.1 hypothetical protein [Methylobacteriaceae bacterium]HPG02556.1 hypothetical protein [Rhodoblastus sp.]HRY01770.1 hypothetical protein [Beijerinckiaceae bacterium]
MTDLTQAKGPFVIRSMSTTDWNGRDPVKPYHVYLLPVAKRARAYWTSSSYERATYPSIEAAKAEIDRCKLDGCDIAPADDRGFPTYWDLRNAQINAEVSSLLPPSLESGK